MPVPVLAAPGCPVNTTKRAPLETSTAMADMRGGRVPRMTCPWEARGRTRVRHTSGNRDGSSQRTRGAQP
eukprot:9210612-Lingulodinium_polyedra.AAC.1